MLTEVSLLFGEANIKKLVKISFVDTPIKTHIDQLTKDTKCPNLKKIHASPFLTIQCDETTDASQLSQLLAHVHFVGPSSTERECWFVDLETITKAEAVFQVVATFFGKNGMKLEKIVGVCTDIALAILGSRNGFIAKIKQEGLNTIGSHCMIHRTVRLWHPGLYLLQLKMDLQ